MIKFYVIKRDDLYVTYLGPKAGYFLTAKPCDSHAAMNPPTREDLEGIAEALCVDSSSLAVVEWSIEEVVSQALDNNLWKTERS